MEQKKLSENGWLFQQVISMSHYNISNKADFLTHNLITTYANHLSVKTSK